MAKAINKKDEELDEEIDETPEEVDTEETGEEAEQPKTKKAKAVVSVTVEHETLANGESRRVYSAAQHGPDFQDLAKEFISKSPNTRRLV